MTGTLVSFTAEERIGFVRLCNPPANALGSAVLQQLDRALTAAVETAVKVLVVTSDVEGFFAAGADIKQMVDLSQEDFASYHYEMRAVFGKLSGSPLVSIAAIDGRALGGGLELALACTLRVAGAHAQLGLPESKLGLIPGAGGTQRLPRLVGRGCALDLMLTGRSVGAAEAGQLGLVDRVAAAGSAQATARQLATELASRPASALRSIQRCVDTAQDLALEQGLALESGEVLALFERGEAREGLAAFVERREPRFT